MDMKTDFLTAFSFTVTTQKPQNICRKNKQIISIYFFNLCNNKGDELIFKHLSIVISAHILASTSRRLMFLSEIYII